MKSILSKIFIISFFLIIGCTNQSNIPSKINNSVKTFYDGYLANDSNMIFNLGGKFTRAGGKFLKKMEDAYKGEDDIWKIYNYQFELNKLKTARARYIASA